ncbi:Hypothetical predicted protein [Octopus vulgaris]|uniref:Uncharacterized protein n=1 Tax=Octopus vulgaris TaxID=6645 RepID=A0AA36EUK3_OCTVU|nr:Hypothetical predicted protein [Octopus vulgaris]
MVSRKQQPIDSTGKSLNSAAKLKRRTRPKGVVKAKRYRPSRIVRRYGRKFQNSKVSSFIQKISCLISIEEFKLKLFEPKSCEKKIIRYVSLTRLRKLSLRFILPLPVHDANDICKDEPKKFDSKPKDV